MWPSPGPQNFPGISLSNVSGKNNIFGPERCKWIRKWLKGFSNYGNPFWNVAKQMRRNEIHRWRISSRQN
jgi:hypothetical protein